MLKCAVNLALVAVCVSSYSMLKFAVALALVAVCVSARLDLDDYWMSYKVLHGKRYVTLEEDAQRRSIWEENLAYIQRHNIEADRGMHTFTLGENQFTDMTNDEFRQTMNGYIMAERTGNVQYVPTSVDPPSTMDWRTKGYVTKVKNQEQCGSCWAFSTTGSLEGQHFKKTGNLTSLSEQQLVDCSMKYGNKGCKGGLMENAFKYIKANDGIDTEISYPYVGKTGHTCKFRSEDVGATDSGFVDIKRGSEEALMQALAEIGPISVAMDAGHQSFQHYRKGIYKERECSSIKLDHGVLAVGYGSEMGKDYWIVKNSWGTIWGDEGYFKIARNDHNMCGIATQASYPTV